MPDYQEMYQKLFRATEQAINTLITAQRECEEIYINSPELPPLTFAPPIQKGEEENGT